MDFALDLVEALPSLPADARRFYALRGNAAEAVPTDEILTEGFDMVDASTQVSQTGRRAELQKKGVVALSATLHARIGDALSVRA